MSRPALPVPGVFDLQRSEIQVRTACRRALLWCGVVAGPLFVVAAVAIGRFRDRYDEVRMPISLLAVGNYGWFRSPTLSYVAHLMMASALGMRTVLTGRGSTWAPRLIAIVRLRLVGAGFFPTDPGRGFPPRDQAEQGPTLHGHLHDVFSIAVFVGLPLALCALAGNFSDRGVHGRKRFLTVCGLALALGFAVIVVALNTEVWLSDKRGQVRMGAEVDQDGPGVA
jgi:Protein of unknown function (DUF998)